MADVSENVVRRFITENEAADLAMQALFVARPSLRDTALGLGVDRMTLYYWRRRGRIPVQGRKNYVLECERLFSIPRWLSRPDVYGWPTAAEAHTPIGIIITAQQS